LDFALITPFGVDMHITEWCNSPIAAKRSDRVSGSAVTSEGSLKTEGDVMGGGVGACGIDTRQQRRNATGELGGLWKLGPF
jgi:hypothetical protein